MHAPLIRTVATGETATTSAPTVNVGESVGKAIRRVNNYRTGRVCFLWLRSTLWHPDTPDANGARGRIDCPLSPWNRHGVLCPHLNLMPDIRGQRRVAGAASDDRHRVKDAAGFLRLATPIGTSVRLLSGPRLELLQSPARRAAGPLAFAKRAPRIKSRPAGPRLSGHQHIEWPRRNVEVTANGAVERDLIDPLSHTVGQDLPSAQAHLGDVRLRLALYRPASDSTPPH